MKIIFIIVFMFLSFQAFSGTETGNGGDVVSCENHPKRPTLQLLDYYEAEVFDQDNISERMNALGNDAKTIFNELIGRLKIGNRSRALRFEQWGKEFFEANVVNWVEEDLVDIPDSNHEYLPKACEIKQIAIQEGSYQNTTYKVNKLLWDNLSPGDQAGLVIHELIYREAKYSGHKNSIKVRRYHRKLVKRLLFNDWDYDENTYTYHDSLEAEMGMAFVPATRKGEVEIILTEKYDYKKDFLPVAAIAVSDKFSFQSEDPINSEDTVFAKYFSKEKKLIFDEKIQLKVQTHSKEISFVTRMYEYNYSKKWGYVKSLRGFKVSSSGVIPFQNQHFKGYCYPWGTGSKEIFLVSSGSTFSFPGGCYTLKKSEQKPNEKNYLLFEKKIHDFRYEGQYLQFEEYWSNVLFDSRILRREGVFEGRVISTVNVYGTECVNPRVNYYSSKKYYFFCDYSNPKGVALSYPYLKELRNVKVNGFEEDSEEIRMKLAEDLVIDEAFFKGTCEKGSEFKTTKDSIGYNDSLSRETFKCKAKGKVYALSKRGKLKRVRVRSKDRWITVEWGRVQK